MEETTIIIGTFVFIMGFLTGFLIRDKCCGETDTINTAIDNAILLDADVNREIAKINEDTSEKSIVLKRIYYGINKTAEKGAMKFYPNNALNELINKHFTAQELRKIFNSSGYKIEFKYPLTRSDVSYVSWER